MYAAVMKLKDPGSAITHGIGALLTIAAAVPLIVFAALRANWVGIVAMVVFAVSMLLLYSASTAYHALDISERINCLLRRFDHMMIFALIAGSYTPICLVAMNNRAGYALCAAVWAVAVLGIGVSSLRKKINRVFDAVVYISMGWLCLAAFPQILAALSTLEFIWLLIGGVIYTIGGVIYALKLPLFNARHRHFGSHEIFHVFVMAGSACHFVTMYLLLF